MKLMLAGDVMLGRGLDQALPHPAPPEIHEDYLHSALDYLRLAERRNGPLDRPLDFADPWGDALALMAETGTDARIINLETAVTDRGQPVPKGINYRMGAGNLPALCVAGIDCCMLANNHVLDWGIEGFSDTLTALARVNIAVAGAGMDAVAAASPAILSTPAGRLLVLAGARSSGGVPSTWAAGEGRAGVHLVDGDPQDVARMMSTVIDRHRKPGDRVLFSVHAGKNWGYDIDQDDRRLAHALIETAGVDVVHCHSSHHFKAIEVFSGRLILHGCGDLLNDYEGIGGQEAYRPDLVILLFASLAADGALAALTIAPLRLRRFRLEHARGSDRAFIAARLDRECRRFGRRIVADASGLLALRV